MVTVSVIPVTDFRNSAKDVLEKVKEGPIVLTQRSRPVAIVVDYETYREQEERLQALELALDDLRLLLAKESAEQFISANELFADYEDATGESLAETE